MPPADLLAVFESLALPQRSTSALSIRAASVPGLPSPHRVGKDADGSPALLVRVGYVPESVPDIRLENLSISFGIPCRVWHANAAVEEGLFTVIRCPTQDASIRIHFLEVAGPFLRALGPSPTPARITTLVESLVQLFRALAAPSRKSVQGVWAELFVIEQSQDSKTLTRAWHDLPEERYDFSAGVQRLEVKSAAGRLRRHTFSLEQLQAPGAAIVLIASVLMERAAGGVSLGELAESTRSKVGHDPELVLHIETVLGTTLGAGLRVAMDERYDTELARESLTFFEAHAIPRPPGDMPRGVTDVRFVADLSGVPPATLEHFAGGTGLFSALPTARPQPG